jgi:hypothetical protein
MAIRVIQVMCQKPATIAMKAVFCATGAFSSHPRRAGSPGRPRLPAASGIGAGLLVGPVDALAGSVRVPVRLADEFTASRDVLVVH